jgi:hypothetical protein
MTRPFLRFFFFSHYFFYSQHRRTLKKRGEAAATAVRTSTYINYACAYWCVCVRMCAHCKMTRPTGKSIVLSDPAVLTGDIFYK